MTLRNIILIFKTFLVCVLFLQTGLIVDAQKATKAQRKSAGVGRDTLFVRISRNEKVDIKRTITGNTKKIVGKKVIEYRAYRIEFRNPKKVSLRLDVEDLFPQSKDGSVEVEILESSDAEIDFTHGRLAWNFRLKPNEKKNLDVKYNVTYPKNKIILGIENVLQIQANIRKTV
ncbi:DUF4139 domain-containing protein [Arcicella sp. LKC2W]|uniref:DUF4139 domain-containing protein n=1 Tax=Arcicella sp. LKC2W TaxID=2984198 RepID=UPI002B211E76|nr:DUF4139 domain-containing protein [Arcicella sp. LKC2W]MEA5460609.1 DUF4139 domain-containing protein [Arcicella sp. LKC2W]